MKKIFLFLIVAFWFSDLQANTLDQVKNLIQEKNYSESLKTLQSITEADTDNVEALYYLALNHYLLGEYELTIKHGVQAYTKNPKLADEVREYANEQNFGANAKIGIFRKIRLAKQIKNELYLVLQDEPNNENAHYALGFYYILTPYILSGSVKKSYYHIQELEKADKQRAYRLYSEYFKKTKNAQRHISNLKAWNTDYPDDWFAVLELARYEQDKNNSKKSYELLSQWVERKPGDVKAIYQIGRLAATTGEYLVEGENSLKFYLDQPILAENPEAKWANYRLAMIYQHKNDIAKAKEHLAKSLTDEPKNKEFLKLKSKL